MSTKFQKYFIQRDLEGCIRYIEKECLLIGVDHIRELYIKEIRRQEKRVK